MTADERIAELEKQLAELKKQNVSDKRDQIAAHLIQSFAVEDDNDIIVAHTVDHLGITETTDVDAIISEAEEAYKRNCMRAGRELPMSAAEWCEQYKQKQKENEAYAEELRKQMC